MGDRVVVVGAGIVGLAMSKALAEKGFQVTVIERDEKAIGASIRNFGMIWPIGQPEGHLYERALRSRALWDQLGNAGVFNVDRCGSLHLAYHPDEWTVLQELFTIFSEAGRPVQLFNPGMITTRFQGIKEKGLLGGLFSSTELIVDPRKAVSALPIFLEVKYGVKFIWGRQVSAIKDHTVYTPAGNFEADLIVVCQGQELDSLFPEVFEQQAMVKCKLQMMRFAPNETGFRIGTAICGGLSLIHYESFKVAKTLKDLRLRYEGHLPEYISNGIHVMVSQNSDGELTVGDSHEYGTAFLPFDDNQINGLILAYLKTFAHCENWKLLQSWNGVYAKLKNGGNGCCTRVSDGIIIVNGMGGAGMTLSFGFAEEIVNGIKM